VNKGEKKSASGRSVRDLEQRKTKGSGSALPGAKGKRQGGENSQRPRKTKET